MPTISNYFVCVGAQKASTTWLARVLGEHRELFVTPVKEIHYFDHVRGITAKLNAHKRRSRMRKYLLRMASDWPRFADYKGQWPWYRAYMQNPIGDDWYVNLFRHRGGARMAGEATPEYALIGAEGFTHIKRLAPDARVLFILRNPARQAWSQFLHFDRKLNRKPRAAPVAEAIAFLDSAASAAYRDYAAIIDDLVDVFGAGQVKFLFYEDIHAGRAAALASICEFLGVDASAGNFSNLDRAFNVSPDTDIPPELHDWLRQRYRPVARQVLDRLGRVPEDWRRELLS